MGQPKAAPEKAPRIAAAFGDPRCEGAGSAPERIGTTNLLIRSQTLYPVELRAQKFILAVLSCDNSGRMRPGGPYYIRFEPPSNAGRRRRFFRNHFQVDMPARNGFRKSRSDKELATILGTIVSSSFFNICPTKPDTHSKFRLTDERSLSENFPADEVSFSLLV